MAVFGILKHLVGEYEQFTPSFAYTEHYPPTPGQYFTDYTTTEQPQPFDWIPEHLATLHFALEVRYARLSGLTRDELCRILDAECVMGTDSSSVTFRVLKNSDARAYGEYRTRRLAFNGLGRQ